MGLFSTLMALSDSCCWGIDCQVDKALIRTAPRRQRLVGAASHKNKKHYFQSPSSLSHSGGFKSFISFQCYQGFNSFLRSHWLGVLCYTPKTHKTKQNQIALNYWKAGVESPVNVNFALVGLECLFLLISQFSFIISTVNKMKLVQLLCFCDIKWD